MASRAAGSHAAVRITSLVAVEGRRTPALGGKRRARLPAPAGGGTAPARRTAAVLNDRQLVLVVPRRDHGLASSEMNVHLAPHSDLSGNVNARLDRERDAGHQLALFPALEIIEMRTRAVEIA